ALTIDLDSGGAAVMIDPNDLEQVVFNLVINARDALPDGGAIHVDVARALVDAATKPADSAAAPGEYLRPRVRDNGTGMTPDGGGLLFGAFLPHEGGGRGAGAGPAVRGRHRTARRRLRDDRYRAGPGHDGLGLPAARACRRPAARSRAGARAARPESRRAHGDDPAGRGRERRARDD